MGALDAVTDWPCDNVAAAFVGPDGSIDKVGDTARRFPLASVTKLLTAVTTLIGVEEGSVELDEPRHDEGATLADLLAHSAGLAPDGMRLDLPGRRRIYSNAGYELAAAELERATDIPFAEYLDEAIVQPLGLTATELVTSPAHGGESTVDDLVDFVIGLPSLLAGETIARMTDHHLGELIGVLPGYGRQVPNPWGLGPEIRGDKSPHWTGSANSPSTWGHFGQSGTLLWVDPEHEAALVVLTDRRFGDWALDRWPALADSLLAELS